MGPTRQVFVVDDDESTVKFISHALRHSESQVLSFSTSAEFLEQYDDSGMSPRCLILELELPHRSGLELHRELGNNGAILPVIFLTAACDIASAVHAIQHGAVDFLEKPISGNKLLKIVDRAMSIDEMRRLNRHRQSELETKLESLSRRERDVFDLILDCKSNKQVAAHLKIGFQTAAKYRSNIFRKLGVQTETELMKLMEFHHSRTTVE